jgi:hypothetical protein
VINKNTDGGVTVSVTKDERKISGWVIGEATGGYKFEAKVFDAGSLYGIDGGRVSKLGVRKDNKIVVNYDRGWDVPPQTPEVKAVYRRIIAAMNALDKVTEAEKPKDFLAKIEANKQKVSHDAPKSPDKARGDELC